jgi:hypothetical protein
MNFEFHRNIAPSQSSLGSCCGDGLLALPSVVLEQFWLGKGPSARGTNASIQNSKFKIQNLRR